MFEDDTENATETGDDHLAKIKPGDRLIIEVLEALPGRPISGERLVRPDGTISLGFYGDLMVAGLTRKEIKTNITKHLQKHLIASNHHGASIISTICVARSWQVL